MKKILILFSVLMIIGSLAASSALAIGIGFDNFLESGNTLSADVIVTGLDVAGEIVSAYDLDVLYDTTVLINPIVDFDISWGGYFLYQDTRTKKIDDTNSVINFVDASDLDDQALSQRQGASVKLATLKFEVLNDGPYELEFLWGDGQVVVGRIALPIIPTAPVPEPATMLLLGAGLAGLAGFGRKKFRNG